MYKYNCVLYRSAQRRVKLDRLFLLLKRRPKEVNTCGVHEAIINYYCYINTGIISEPTPEVLPTSILGISSGIHFLVIIYPRLCHSYKNFYTLCTNLCILTSVYLLTSWSRQYRILLISPRIGKKQKNTLIL